MRQYYNEWTNWFASLVAAALPAYLLRFSIVGIPTTALEILIYLFVGLIILTRWGQFRSLPRWVIWPTVLFLLAAVISTIISPDQRAALGILKAWIVDPLLFAWALWQVADRDQLIKTLPVGLIAGGVFVALVALFQRLTGDVTADGRVIGPYAWSAAENASPNYLALYLAPLAVLSSGLAAESLLFRRWTRGFWLTVAFLLIAISIYFSFSRGGLGAVIVGIVVKDALRFWPWIRARSYLKIALITVAITASIGAWFYIRPNPLLSPDEGGRITASNNVRWEIWATTWELLQMPNDKFQIPNWVLGLGLGNYQDVFTELTRGRINYDRISPLALTPHNFLLSVWVNLGLLGLLAVFWLIVEVFSRSWRHAQNWTVAALLGSLAALLVHGLLDTPYFKNDLSLLFWTLAALLILWTKPESITKKSAP